MTSDANSDPGTFSVTGAVGTPLNNLDGATLAADFARVTVTISDAGQTISYTGVSLYTLLTAAQFQYPASPVKNGFLRDYVVVNGSAGQSVVVSEGEIDPGFGGANAAMTDIVAYRQGSTDIAPTLIIPGDVNGGVAGRDLEGITGIAVATANVPLPPSVTNPPTTFTLNGNVITPGEAYDVPAVQALGATTQTDTFLQGASPKTFTFTGASMFTVLASNGLTDAAVLDDYVVATGSDGYGVVYSLGEIDPTYRSGNLALVAYDDGTGTFPSIGGGGGLFRTTAPFDSKGGRYVSNLETLAVNNALPCFARGTRLATPNGAVCVETLLAGDTVLTDAGEARRIRWIGQRRLDCRRHPRPQTVWPIGISAGAFGDGVPHCVLYLSPDHAVYINGVLIPIKYLVNGITIAQVKRPAVHYFHVELDSHDILLAEGLAVESYLDVGDRSVFGNAGQVVTLHPDHASRIWEFAGYARIVVSGPELTAVQSRLNRIAAAPRAPSRRAS